MAPRVLKVSRGQITMKNYELTIDFAGDIQARKGIITRSVLASFRLKRIFTDQLK